MRTASSRSSWLWRGSRSSGCDLFSLDKRGDDPGEQFDLDRPESRRGLQTFVEIGDQLRRQASEVHVSPNERSLGWTSTDLSNPADLHRMSVAAKDPVLTPHEAAEELGVAYCTVLEHLRSGTLAGVKRGNRWYVRRSKLDQFLDPAVPSSSEPAGRVAGSSPNG